MNYDVLTYSFMPLVFILAVLVNTFAAYRWAHGFGRKARHQAYALDALATVLLIVSAIQATFLDTLVALGMALAVGLLLTQVLLWLLWLSRGKRSMRAAHRSF